MSIQPLTEVGDPDSDVLCTDLHCREHAPAGQVVCVSDRNGEKLRDLGNGKKLFRLCPPCGVAVGGGRSEKAGKEDALKTGKADQQAQDLSWRDLRRLGRVLEEAEEVIVHARSLHALGKVAGRAAHREFLGQRDGPAAGAPVGRGLRPSPRGPDLRLLLAVAKGITFRGCGHATSLLCVRPAPPAPLGLERERQAIIPDLTHAVWLNHDDAHPAA